MGPLLRDNGIIMINSNKFIQSHRRILASMYLPYIGNTSSIHDSYTVLIFYTGIIS